MFKVGDKIRIIKLTGKAQSSDNYNYREYGLEIGHEGTIINIVEHKRLKYAVEFDSKIKGGHRCNGRIPSGNGLWVGEDVIEHMQETQKDIIKRELLSLGV